MGFDFKPRNKDAGDYHLGEFSWPSMLDAGLGLVLGTGPGFRPSEFVHVSRPDGLCVQYNDGAAVTAEECKDLAKWARWIARVQEARINAFDKLTDVEKNQIRADESGVYKQPWSRVRVEQFRDFADWCERSGGFEIH